MGVGWKALAVALASLALIASGESAARAAAPPAHFFGVVTQGDLNSADLQRMDGVIGTLRIGVYWPSVEPSPGVFALAHLDAVVRAAAAHDIEILPFLYGTPPWLGSDPMRSPLRYHGGAAAWSNALTELVSRYGPKGDVWDGGGSDLPIRQWQIWNEPNFPLFWHPRPAPAEYARLLSVSNRALAIADPGAKVIAAGVAPVGGGPRPWRYIQSLLRIPGARAAVDEVALHPYSASPLGVEYAIRKTRHAMARVGAAGMPLLIGEVGVASHAEVPTGFDLGPHGQALFLSRTLELLIENRRRWHIAGVDWFSWQDVPSWEEQCSFCQFSGLVDQSDQPKPSWFAYRRVVWES